MKSSDLPSSPRPFALPSSAASARFRFFHSSCRSHVATSQLSVLHLAHQTLPTKVLHQLTFTLVSHPRRTPSSSCPSHTNLRKTSSAKAARLTSRSLPTRPTAFNSFNNGSMPSSHSVMGLPQVFANSFGSSVEPTAWQNFDRSFRRCHSYHRVGGSHVEEGSVFFSRNSSSDAVHERAAVALAPVTVLPSPSFQVPCIHSGQSGFFSAKSSFQQGSKHVSPSSAEKMNETQSSSPHISVVSVKHVTSRQVCDRGCQTSVISPPSVVNVHSSQQLPAQTEICKIDLCTANASSFPDHGQNCDLEMPTRPALQSAHSTVGQIS